MSSKSSYYNVFWKIMWHWRLDNDAENSALHHRNKLHFYLYQNRKQLFLGVMTFHNITVFITVFLIK